MTVANQWANATAGLPCMTCADNNNEREDTIMRFAKGFVKKSAVLGMLALSASMFSGCATPTQPPLRVYSGPELRSEKVAVIRVEKMNGPRGDPISIRAVDGKEVRYDSFVIAHDGYPTEVQVLPGHRQIHVKFDHPVAGIAGKMTANTLERKLELDCGAGRTYLIRQGVYKEKNELRLFQGGRTAFWIEDAATGRTVGGDCPTNVVWGKARPTNPNP